ncbi:MAG TPA: hypothetical protein VEK34_00375 [Methylocella sp.]|nr:hypothetical protein [Methylocella sp.]
MPDAYVIEVGGLTAGIVARDSQSRSFNFFSADRAFIAMEGQRFTDPLAAERTARMLAKHGRLPPRRSRSAPADGARHWRRFG